MQEIKSQSELEDRILDNYMEADSLEGGSPLRGSLSETEGEASFGAAQTEGREILHSQNDGMKTR